MAEVKCVVFDFDGTLTDPGAEAALFEALYREKLAAATTPLVLAHWSAAANQVDTAPETHGLMIGRVIAAPGDADPYVRCFTLTQLLDKELKLASSYEALQQVAVECYQAVYSEMTAHHWSNAMFRADAAACLSALRELDIQLWVVSNADVRLVEKRLAALWGSPPLRVVGNAQKHCIGPSRNADPALLAISEDTFLPGLARPLKLQRGLYFDALRKVWSESQVGPSDTLVVGDIYEMDLALPAALGASVHLIQNGRTRQPYLDALRGLQGRGGFSRDLRAVVTRAARSKT